MIFGAAADRARFLTDKMGKVDLAAGDHLFSGLNAFEPGQEHAPHTHCERDKLYVGLRGQGIVTIGEDESEFGPGDVALAPAGVTHSMRNPGPERLVVLVVMGPPPAPR